MKISFKIISTLLFLVMVITSCEEEPDEYILYQQHAIHHFYAHFALYIIPNACDTIILKELDSLEIQRILEQITTILVDSSYEIYGYSFKLETSHLEDDYIEFKQSRKQYEITLTNNQMNDSSGNWGKSSRQTKGGRVRAVNSSDEVYYYSLKYKYHNGTVINFIIYYKGKKNGDFKKKSDDDTARFLDNNVSNIIYHLDWSKVYNENRIDILPTQTFEKDIICN